MKRNQRNEGAAAAWCQGQQMAMDALIARLEGLAPGRYLRARDGTPFIRTDRICACYCNLVTGTLCSARDICYRFGGVDERALAMQERELFVMPPQGGQHG